MTKQPPHPGPVTIVEVARRAGVSTATAGRALGDYGAVSPAARQRVLAAAAELGYRPNALARSMITRRTFTLGAIIGDIENPFFGRLVRGISDTARAEGFEVVLVNTDEDVDAERAAVKVLLDKRVDGVIVAPASASDADHLVAAQAAGCPVVLVDRRVRGLAADTVVIDNRTAAKDGVARLLAAGHRRIALVTGGGSARRRPQGRRRVISTGLERIDGYRRALRAGGVSAVDTYLRSTAYTHELAFELTTDLLRLPQPPTAVFTSDLITATGALRAIREQGLAIPADLSFVAFDDADWTTAVTPPLSVVSQPAYEMGRMAARRLVERVHGGGGEPGVHQLPTTFVSRQSVGPPPSGR